MNVLNMGRKVPQTHAPTNPIEMPHYKLLITRLNMSDLLFVLKGN